ncbi:MAG TPA: polysaccharide deacetylase family protein [Blastocatellia bacterium]|nr:polysaccharide deacetylase family protein [Blastocatellia bacterium]
MIGPITIKRAIKRTTGWAAILADLLAGDTDTTRATIFYYHRVADLGFVDPRNDDWNVPPRAFEKQIATLREFAEVVPLHELPARLAASPANGRPIVSLTFDDGYASFCYDALPVLRNYDVPATVFVITSLIGMPGPVPFDRWSQHNSRRAPSEVWRSMSWKEIETCLAAGIITIGAHSHRHLMGRYCDREQLADETGLSREILRSRLGHGHALAYAYPYGSTKLGYVPPSYVDAVRAAGYQMAVTTDLGLASAESDPYLLPRLEAHGLDSPGVIKAKTTGTLGPYYLSDRLRMAVAQYER